jgi:hypothetical protein
MSIKYTATYNGQKFVRRSKRDASRPYTHCIIARKSEGYYNPFDLSHAIENIEHAKSNIWKKYYPDNSNNSHLSVENARYTELANTPYEDYLQDRFNDALCHFETLDLEKYHVIAWAGRPDLALKQVAEISTHPEWSDVRAIPANA